MSFWSVTPVRLIPDPLIVFGGCATLCCFRISNILGLVQCLKYNTFLPFPLHSAEYMGLGYVDSLLLQVTVSF